MAVVAPNTRFLSQLRPSDANPAIDVAPRSNAVDIVCVPLECVLVLPTMSQFVIGGAHPVAREASPQVNVIFAAGAYRMLFEGHARSG